MKKLLFTVVAVVAIGFISAEAKPGKKQDSKLVASFTADFAGATNVAWTEDADFYYARFTQDGKNVTAVYEKETGDYVGHLKIIDVDNLPSTIRKTIADKFDGYKPVGTVAEAAGREKDSYIFNMENDKQILKVKVDTNGTATVISRIRKA